MTGSGQHKFTQAEQLIGPGVDAESNVWDAVKSAFSKREAIGYWRYPLFVGGGRRREPDILVADRELGVLIVEVKGIHIEDIEGIKGHEWYFRPGFYTRKANPYQQAEDQWFKLEGRFRSERALRGSVAGTVVVALPFVTRKQWEERGLHKNPACPPILFADDLTPARFLKVMEQAPPIGDQNVNLDDEQWTLFCAILGHSNVLSAEPKEITPPTGSRASIIESSRTALSEIDLRQQKVGKQVPPGPQRIRGIAGSGKTVLLAQKAAIMHLRHPDWDIALVFFTRSLYQHVIDLVNRWLLAFSDDEVGYNPSSKLKVLHAWGAFNQPGFYGTVAQSAGQKVLNANDSNSAGYPFASGLNWCCKELLQSATIRQQFDAVLIDEGQDLVTDDPNLQVGGRQPFYLLAYNSLRPATSKSPDRRLIWAYDEAQSLDSLRIPTARDLFGAAQSKMVTGMYEGGIRKSEVMHRCYRTPAQVLVAAHAIGMGLMRPEGPVASIPNAEGWRSLGYEVEGDFRKAGEEITLTRPAESTPCPIGADNGNMIKFTEFPSRTGGDGEITAMCAKIKHAVEVEKVDPTDILIVFPQIDSKTLIEVVAQQLMRLGVKFYVAAAPKTNTTEWGWREARPNKFTELGCVTLSGLHRAKGNEAHIVFVPCIDILGKLESELTELPLFASEQAKIIQDRQDQIIRLRNSLFVSISRSKGWVELSGVGSYILHSEIKQVLEAETKIKFLNRPARRAVAIH